MSQWSQAEFKANYILEIRPVHLRSVGIYYVTKAIIKSISLEEFEIFPVSSILKIK